MIHYYFDLLKELLKIHQIDLKFKLVQKVLLDTL